MTVRKAFVVSRDCPYCQTVKERIKQKGLNIEIIDADSPKGYAFAEKHNIQAVPTCVVITRHGRKETVRFCSDKEVDKLLR